MNRELSDWASRTIMKSPHIVCTLFVVVLILRSSQLHAQLLWRVSVKFILDANGQRAARGDLITDSTVRAKFDLYNRILDTLGRGYNFYLTESLGLS